MRRRTLVALALVALALVAGTPLMVPDEPEESLTVRVLEARRPLRPLKDALVEIFLPRELDPRAEPTDRWDVAIEGLVEPLGVARSSKRTDSAGEIVEPLGSSRELIVRVSADGRASETRRVARGERLVEVELVRAVEAHGHVNAAGVALTALVEGIPVEETVSEAGGDFTFRKLAAGRLSFVHARPSPAFQEELVPVVAPRDVELMLERPCTLAVSAAFGSDVEPALSRLFLGVHDGRSFRASARLRGLPGTPLPKASFPQLPAGRYTVRFTGEGLAPATVPVTLEAGRTTEVALELRRPRTVMLRVLDPWNRRLRAAACSRFGAWSRSEAGSLPVPNLPWEEVDIVVDAAGFESRTVRVPAGVGSLDVTLHPLRR